MSNRSFELPERYLSVLEAAEYLGIAKATMYRYIYTDAVPYVHGPNGRLRILESDVRALIAFLPSWYDTASSDGEEPDDVPE